MKVLKKNWKSLVTILLVVSCSAAKLAPEEQDLVKMVNKESRTCSGHISKDILPMMTSSKETNSGQLKFPKDSDKIVAMWTKLDVSKLSRNHQESMGKLFANWSKNKKNLIKEKTSKASNSCTTKVKSLFAGAVEDMKNGKWHFEEKNLYREKLNDYLSKNMGTTEPNWLLNFCPIAEKATKALELNVSEKSLCKWYQTKYSNLKESLVSKKIKPASFAAKEVALLGNLKTDMQKFVDFLKTN